MTAALTADVRRLLDHVGVLTSSDDIEPLHQARVALRRLRTHLRTFRPLLDPTVVSALAPDLARLGNAIGTVRDHDVFVEILDTYAHRLDGELGLPELLARYQSQRAALLADLAGTLVTERVLDMLAAVAELATDPPLVALVDEPAADVLTALARKPWRKLVRAARARDDGSSVGDLHELRIRVKQARYAAEAAALVRPVAAAHVPALARLQTTLGDINDAAFAIHRLRTAVLDGELDAAQAYAAGVVATMERRRIDERRRAWPGRWDEARRKRSRARLDGPE